MNNMKKTNSTIEKILAKRGGQIATVTTERLLKVRKGSPEIVKVSTFQCRVGVNYDNMSAVQQKREDGTLPEENAGLPYGKWVTFPYIIENKDTLYARFSAFKSNFIATALYSIDGVEIDRETAKRYALSNEFKDKSSSSDVFNVKVENIIKIV